MATESLIWLILVPPILAFIIISLFTHPSRRASHILALMGVGLSWLIAMVLCYRAIQQDSLAENPFRSVINWLPLGEDWLQIGVQVDPLTTVTLFFVAWTILMIFIYSVGYHNFGQPAGDHDKPGFPPHGALVKDKSGEMHKVPSIEPMYSRFFAYFSLFAFAMYLLVVSDNLLTLFVGWEVMGLCSYLLIGFWFGKKSARDAGVKAFLTTRVGDMFLLLGLAALYSLTGTLSYQEILADETVLSSLASTPSVIPGLSWAGLIGLLIFMGVVGKSAQFPLHVWLPDAMEGPTPVSAMIHAATMVSAGVYLAIRFFPLLSAGWHPGDPLTTTMFIVSITGAFTALFAATIALAQNDIKKVLAYSTISQLGYMIAALGMGAYVAAAFHLVTHAFFKALLFLGSGSVIHGMEHGLLHTGEEIDPQNMLNMGGLRKNMPATFWTFLIGGLSLAGFPLITAGFYSKDAIFEGVFGSGYLIGFIVLALAALLTAFYTMRQITLTFLGESRTKSGSHSHESSRIMTIPLVILSFFAISIGWLGIPENFPLIGGLSPDWFYTFLSPMVPFELEHEAAHSLVPLITSLSVSLGGLLLGWLAYRNYEAGAVDPLKKSFAPLYSILEKKYYIDELYHIIFVKPAIWLAETFSYRLIDVTIIDGFLHWIWRAGWGIGFFLRKNIDLPFINAAGDGIASGTQKAGGSMRRMQTGQVQQYLIFSLLTILLVSFVFYFFIVRA